MFENFTTIDFILSHPGMIATVILLVQFTKRLWDKAGNTSTRFVALFYAFILCVLAGYLKGEFSEPILVVQTILVWLVNMVIVWFAAMKTFETIAEPMSKTVNITVDKNGDQDMYKEALDVAATHLDEFKIVKLKAGTMPQLSSRK